MSDWTYAIIVAILCAIELLCGYKAGKAQGWRDACNERLAKAKPDAGKGEIDATGWPTTGKNRG